VGTPMRRENATLFSLFAQTMIERLGWCIEWMSRRESPE
jgi:hypothetical protein